MKSLYALRDITGNKIHAHGGGFLFAEGFWYWYGEDRRNGNYVSLYRSKDGKKWEFVRTILSVDSPNEILPHCKGGIVHEDGSKINVERPKIHYFPKSKLYVMWAHYENGRDYGDAGICLASSPSIEEEFVFHGFFRPFGHMSRDCTLFEDEDGVCYFLSASNDNADLHIYEIDEGGFNLTRLVSVQFIGQFREAPALMKRDGVYYLLTSACTGWFPNQACYAFTKSLEEPFSPLIPIGDSTTYHSQPMYIISLPNRDIYVGDRWGGKSWKSIEEFDYFKSTYVTTNIIIKKGKLRFQDSWND